MTTWVRGSELSVELQRQCLAVFVERNTGDHISPRLRAVPPQHRPPQVFNSDEEWLANTEFAVTKDCKKLNGNTTHCRTALVDPLKEAVRVVVAVLEWPRDRFGRLDPAAVPNSHIVKDQLSALAIRYKALGVDYMEQCAGILRAVINNPKVKR